MLHPDSLFQEKEIPQTISKIINDDFFAAVEISHIADQEVRNKVKEILQSSKDRVAFVAAPTILGRGLDLSSRDPAKREYAISAIKELIDEASVYNAESLSVMSGPDPGENLRLETKKILVQSLLDLCAYAQTKRMMINLETFDRGVDKKRLIGPSEEAVKISQEIRKVFPSFGLLYDLAHGLLLEEQPSDSLKILREHLVQVHVGNCVKRIDNALYGDKHPRFGIEGGMCGVPELSNFIGSLIDIGYIDLSSPKSPRPIVGFELKSNKIEDPEELIENCKTTWSRAWSIVPERFAEIKR
jgi:sugar phosphate isomerase/epimerase